MCIASLFGGLALANAGLGAVHGIAGPFGGRFKAPHGAVCGRLLTFVISANIAALRERDPGSPALARLQEAARILTGSPGASADDAGSCLRELCGRLPVPALSAYGFSSEQAADLVSAAMRSSSMRGNPIDLTQTELLSILNQAM
jgi:alcohol dehydrogenase class IV